MMNITEQTVLDLLANSLFNANRDIQSDVDWHSVYQECIQQAVIVVAWQEARKYADYMPEGLAAKWNKKAKINSANSVLVRWSHVNLHYLMTQNNIDYVILKGCAAAAYYPNPADRTLGDVDFLVNKADMEEAGKILETAGFKPWEEEHICHVVYRKEKEHLEMHFEPAGIPYGKAGEMVRAYLSDVMNCRREITENGDTMMIPSDFHHGLIILLHTSHHMLGEGIGLRHLCDWAVFYSHFTEDEFCALFEEKLKKIGIWHFAQLLTLTSEKCLGSPHHAWAECQDADIVDDIIGDIFDGGNFGNKNYDRSQETMLISSRGKNGVGSKSMLGQFVLSMNDIVLINWPLSRKIPLLIPVGWCYFIMRRCIKIILGKRNMLDLNKVFDEAAARKKLYMKFKLFEENKDT